MRSALLAGARLVDVTAVDGDRGHLGVGVASHLQAPANPTSAERCRRSRSSTALSAATASSTVAATSGQPAAASGAAATSRSKRTSASWASHPGEVLLEEFLEPMQLSQYRLAKDISVPPRRMNEIVHCRPSTTSTPKPTAWATA